MTPTYSLFGDDLFGAELPSFPLSFEIVLSHIERDAKNFPVKTGPATGAGHMTSARPLSEL